MGDNSYVYRSYRGKTGRGAFLSLPLSWIGLKPTQRDFDLNILIFHIGTNNLSSNDSPEIIANKIVETTESLKTEDNNRGQTEWKGCKSE